MPSTRPAGAQPAASRGHWARAGRGGSPSGPSRPSSGPSAYRARPIPAPRASTPGEPCRQLVDAAVAVSAEEAFVAVHSRTMTSRAGCCTERCG